MLDAKVRDYLIESLDILRSVEMPLVLDVSVGYRDQDDRTSFFYTVEEKPEYWRAVVAQRSALLGLKSLGELLNGMRRSCPTGRELEFLAGTSGESEIELKARLQSRFLDLFLVDYLARSTDLEFDARAFSDVYSQFEEYIFHFETVRTSWLVRFQSLRLEESSVELESGVRLRAATTDEASVALKPFIQKTIDQMPFLLRRNDPSIFTLPDLPRTFLEIEDVARYDSALERPTLLGYQLLTTLRMMHDCRVCADSIWYRSSNVFGPILPSRVPLMSCTGQSSFGVDFILRQEDSDRLGQIWADLSVLPTNNQLDLALRRLNDAALRSEAEDRLIDFWIALEALFLKGTKAELNFRASLYIAMYVGGSLNERREILKMMKHSYSLRSKVAHGEKLNDGDEIDTVVLETGEVLRRILQKCVAQKRPPDVDLITEKLLEYSENGAGISVVVLDPH